MPKISEVVLILTFITLNLSEHGAGVKLRAVVSEKETTASLRLFILRFLKKVEFYNLWLAAFPYILLPSKP